MVHEKALLWLEMAWILIVRIRAPAWLDKPRAGRIVKTWLDKPRAGRMQPHECHRNRLSLAKIREVSMANIDTVRAFFAAFAATPTAAQITVFVPNLFSPDTPAGAPTSPSLGIAGGRQTNAAPPLSLGPQAGPQFRGRADIITCFTQIVTSFDTSTFTTLPAANPVFCFSPDGNTITVPAILHTNNHRKPWFQFGHKAYSKPLSDIEPDGTQISDVPACTVFTFDTTAGNPQNRILNLAIFMDRWQMAVDLWPNTGHGKHQPRPFPAP
jgi:hypothetical protein